jgi:hypothetical protein
MNRRRHQPDRKHPPENAGLGDPRSTPRTQPARHSRTSPAPWAAVLSPTEHAAIVAAVRAMPAMTDHQVDDVCDAITAARERWRRAHRDISAA